MTTEELIQYYKDLLIIQYNNKDKALATIALIAENSVYDMIPIQLYDALDLDNSVGAQLDLVGKYVGVQRTGRTFSSVIELSDDDFRSLIKIAIAKNYSQSTLYDIQNLIFQFFPMQLLVFDYQNMSMSYLFDSSIGSEQLAEMFVVNNLLPKPMCVQVGALIYSGNVDSFFGFRTYTINTPNNTAFNSYGSYSEVAPWLSYDNAIIA